MSSPTELRLTHDPLTALDPHQAPSPAAVNRLRRELYANSRAIHKDGGGAYGHLGIVMPVAEYTALTGAAYVEPMYPDIPDYHTQPDVAIRQGWEASYKQQVTDAQVATALRNRLVALIIQAVPRTFIALLEDATHGFAEVTPQQLLEHLTTTFGTIHPQDLNANLKRLCAPWDPATSIHTVFTNAEQCRQFAAPSTDPITENTLVRNLATTFRQSGVFNLDSDSWDKKPVTDMTLTNLRVHFLEADRIRLLYNQATTDVLTANSAITNGATEATKPPPVGPSYCWTHGYCYHTSATCRFPATGHCKDATGTNQMGGNTSALKSSNQSQATRKKRAAKEAAKQSAVIAEAVKTAMMAFRAEHV
jgi:hypothetical protein